MRAFFFACIAIAACGSSTSSPTDGGSEAGEGGGGEGGTTCCPRGGGSCAGGGSRRLTSCAQVCDCLMITGTGIDADGCPFDQYVSTYPNCGGMVKDSGTDAPKDAPAE